MKYGNDGTIHGTTNLNVEVDKKGKVVSVWFRCMALPFDVHETSDERAADMRRMYAELDRKGQTELHAVEIKHRLIRWIVEKQHLCSIYYYVTKPESVVLMVTENVHDSAKYGTKEEAQKIITRFGLDSSWHAVEHTFIED